MHDELVVEPHEAVRAHRHRELPSTAVTLPTAQRLVAEVLDLIECRHGERDAVAA